MSKFLKTLAAAAALSAAAPAVAQPYGAPDLARYDARQAQSLGQQLVLCDLASYFRTRPDLDAHRVYVRRDVNRFEPTLPIAITRGGAWHDEDLERAFLRHRAAGRVSEREAFAVRREYGREMERTFWRTDLREQRFFQDQGQFCRDLVRASWR